MIEQGTTTASPLAGLSSSEAARLLEQFGPNEVAEEKTHPLLALLRKFWSPVPWMLEITIILQIAIGKPDEAAVIAVLLVVNAVLGYLQEGRANKALTLLRQRLDIQARVLRDGRWQFVPARNLVPGDAVHLRMGDLVPADLRLVEGRVQVDQSTLTGESLPVESGPGTDVWSGAVVTRGEATGQVTATGSRTRFGKTAELVRSAKTVSHLEAVIFGIVKYLVLLDIVLVAALLVYAVTTGMALVDVVPFALILLVASVPVALPATFTLATALGSLELAKRGVLVTRLSAIEEAAAMDVLASDKTGTITENRLSLAALKPANGISENDLLRIAAIACDDATQDPIDLAILGAARERSLLQSPPRRIRFTPFDPQTRRSETVFEENGLTRRAVKGASLEVAALAGAPDVAAEVEALAAGGYRVLGVAIGDETALQFAGLVALQDPPRKDSAALVENLRQLGVRVVMVTGDGQATARTVAKEVGIGERTCPASMLVENGASSIAQCDVFAQVFPEDKFHLVQALQRSGHVTGMTGDGVNDAPALKQAEVGIAVANATDVAKAAASLVLTNPGLGDVVAAVETSRRIYQRMLTYTLNKIIKTLEIAIFMSVGVMLTGVFVITPLLIVLLLFTNDFVTMSIATDRVEFSRKPERWRIPNLMATAAPLAALILVLSFSVFFVGRDWLHLPLPQLQTLIFVMLVFTGLGNVYLVRERRHFWRSRPSRWLLIASVIDIAVVGLMASQGILMTAISPALIGGLLAVAMGYLVLMDFLKIGIFRRFGLA
ncbi:plasma-membrane proton-efflux P-type ATPase [Caldichromatium japonicum]|uniref:Plasma-membrane proton-efflux P-type ATPase n=1 Tax=Caldichromatium japonicum TaxID=2699430 RepID=A0A6G7VFZ0_9GAMM|nr:plasma-membrane proton-efflux P-type ATPase [Caldichromatium japonicum]QIK38707.1 plasma-membrane proton-efflux P-type ATPase [Caldichromatium japonicum]